MRSKENKHSYDHIKGTWFWGGGGGVSRPTLNGKIIAKKVFTTLPVVAFIQSVVVPANEAWVLLTATEIHLTPVEADNLAVPCHLIPRANVCSNLAGVIMLAFVQNSTLCRRTPAISHYVIGICHVTNDMATAACTARTEA